MRRFAKIKASRNGENSLSFTYVVKSCQSREFLHGKMSFNAICENKILAEISEFTVCILVVCIAIANKIDPDQTVPTLDHADLTFSK